jgi:hypothetical protein
MAVYLRPVADSTIGGWATEAASTVSLYASIDEAVADDLDYITSGNLEASTVSDVYIAKLTTGQTVSLPFTVRYRYGKDVSGSQKVDLSVRLLEGTTAVSTWSHLNISTGFETTSQTVSTSATITDFNNLFLEFSASMQRGSGEPVGLLLALTQP